MAHSASVNGADTAPRCHRAAVGVCGSLCIRKKLKMNEALDDVYIPAMSVVYQRHDGSVYSVVVDMC